jgi:hypothetical protein
MTDFPVYTSSPRERSSSPPPAFPNPVQTTQSSSLQKRPIDEVIAQHFLPFDHRSVVSPFEEETKRDAFFQQGKWIAEFDCVFPRLYFSGMIAVLAMRLYAGNWRMFFCVLHSHRTRQSHCGRKLQ